MSADPQAERRRFSVQYLEPLELEPEPLPEEFNTSRLKRSLVVIAVFVVLVVALVTLVPGLGSLRQRFAGAQPGWLAAAAVLELLSCASYVLAFRTVFCRRMSWRTSAEIGFAELGANSLFSVGGAGGLALGAWILRRGGMAADRIARRTVAFFLLTSLANVGFLVLGGLGLATGVLHGSPGLLYGLLPAAAGIAAIALALLARPAADALAGRVDAHARVARALRAAADGVREALAILRAREPGVAIGTAGYLLFDVAMLGVCFAAFGMDVPPAGVLLLAYLIGQLGGLIPIPGGLGGVDGGLIGTLALFGVAPAEAAVAVLAYRGLLLAIPAALGLPSLLVLRRRLRAESVDFAACGPGQEVEVLGRGRLRRWQAVAERAECRP